MTRKKTLTISPSRKKWLGVVAIFILVAWIIVLFGSAINKAVGSPISNAKMPMVESVAMDLMEVGIGVLLVLVGLILMPVILKIVAFTLILIGAIFIIQNLRELFSIYKSNQVNNS